jgi:hypothetical protein
MPAIERTKLTGRRVQDTGTDGQKCLGTFKGWDENGAALIHWDGYPESDLDSTFRWDWA